MANPSPAPEGGVRACDPRRPVSKTRGRSAGADALARQHGVRLAGEGVDRLPVEVDGKEMTRVLSNLVNAIRHTPADGTVAIAAERRADAVVLSVTDARGGIPEERRPRSRGGRSGSG